MSECSQLTGWASSIYGNRHGESVLQQYIYQRSWQDFMVYSTFVVYLNACLYDGKKIYDPIYPTPPLGQDMTKAQFFKRSLAGLNSEFSFSQTSCLTKAEEPSLPNYLPIAGGRIIGFIPFPRVLVLCEMQSVLSRN